MTQKQRLKEIKTAGLGLITQLKKNFFIAPYYYQQLMQEYCDDIDQLVIKNLSEKIDISNLNFALIALGGYGRKELYPYSDLDLLVVCSNENDKKSIANACLFLWQLPMKINISYRNFDEITNDIDIDITFFTSLLDRRMLLGKHKLYSTLNQMVKSQPISPQFFLSSEVETQLIKHSSVKQNLEPNLKHIPGGLRTLHQLYWFIDYFQLDTPILNKKQSMLLTKAKYSIGQIRFGLHLIAEKNENTLYFHYQKSLVDKLKLNDINQMMRPLYQSMLDSLFYYLYITEKLSSPIKLDEMPSYNSTDIDLLNKLLLETVPHHSQHDNTHSAIVLAEQIRQFKKIDSLSKEIEIQHYFLKLFLNPHTLLKHLQLLHYSGLLSRYLPLFSHTVGLSQFDLFHRFTVDFHTIKVIEQAIYLYQGKFKQSMPDASQLIQTRKPHILLLSLLFHDLGKGKGGNHEIVASDYVKAYLKPHISDAFLSEDDVNLISLLVEHHLTMSHITQKKDISDPYVIKEFISLLKCKASLDYLYLLTICDIRGTNPSLWNNWRYSLLTTLYHKSVNAFENINEQLSNLSHLNIAEARINDGKINRLKNKYPLDKLNYFLNLWGEQYLSHFSPSSIQWHLDLLIDKLNLPSIQIFSRFNPRIKQAEIITYSKNKRLIFGPIASITTRLSLTILDARIYTAQSGETFSQYVINHQNINTSLNDEFILESIIKRIKSMLNDADFKYPVQFRKRASKRYILEKKTDVSIQLINQKQLVVELQSLDYPGILADIVSVFDHFNLYITHAKINTLDQKIYDIFYLNTQNASSNEIDIAQLRSKLISITSLD